MEKIKLAFIASTLTIGGAEKVIYELISKLPSSKFITRLFILRSMGHVGQILFEEKKEVKADLFKSRFDPIGPIRLFLSLNKFSPHILFSLDHHNAMFWGRLCSFLGAVPVRVIASHCTGKYGGKRNFNMLDRLLMGITDAIVALSETHSRYLCEHEGISEAKVHVIENGIDVEYFHTRSIEGSGRLGEELGLNKSNKVVIMVAAFRPEKAHETLLETASILRARFPELRFLLVGEGPRRSLIEEQARKLKLDNMVIFTGPREDIAELLALADVLVLPSKPVVETLPLVILEAMAVGIPVIASSVGSIPEVIREGENGFLIPAGDSSLLANKIEYVLFNPGSRKEIERMVELAGVQVRKRYGIEKMLSKYCDLFEGLLMAKVPES